MPLQTENSSVLEEVKLKITRTEIRKYLLTVPSTSEVLCNAFYI